MVVTITPNLLAFPMLMTDNVKLTVRLYNPSEFHVAYKVKSTAEKGAYSVSPAIGCIPAQGSLDISVEKVAAHQEASLGATWFMVLSAYIAPDDLTKCTVANLWPTIGRRKTAVHENKLKVIYSDSQTGAIPQTSQGCFESPESLLDYPANSAPEDRPPPYEELEPSPRNQEPPQQPWSISQPRRRRQRPNPVLSTRAAIQRSTTSTSTAAEITTVRDRGIISDNTNANANYTSRASTPLHAAQSPVQNIPLSVVDSGSPAETMTVTDRGLDSSSSSRSSSNRDSARNIRQVSFSFPTPSTQAPTVQSAPLSDVDDSGSTMSKADLTSMLNTVRNISNSADQLVPTITAISKHCLHEETIAHVKPSRSFLIMFTVGVVMATLIVERLLF